MRILDDLESRGLIFQTTDKEQLDKALSEGSVRLYVGFDPTADSLHIGSLLPILTVRRFQLAGHQPMILVGGATGLIGDPSGRKQERTLNDEQTVANWTQKLQRQLSRFLDFNDGNNRAVAVNNYDWTSQMSAIDMLRGIGKNFSVNSMLAKESVSSRLEAGISFTEFSYMLLQSNDFLHLFQNEHCLLQIGGSDQWGNITAGIDLIRRVTGEQAYGLTLPLVTKSDGTKFGKTESGAIWLDASKTSVYQFYQFWLNTEDNDVIRFLRYFTFLTEPEIAELEQALATDPGQRQAQKTLAEQVTTLVHGQAETQKAIHMSNVLFSGLVQELSVEQIEEVFEGVPSVTLPTVHPKHILNVLVDGSVCSSKRQAREDVTNGAITVNGERVTDLEKVFRDEEMIGQYLVIRRGKKKYFLVKFADDTGN